VDQLIPFLGQPRPPEKAKGPVTAAEANWCRPREFFSPGADGPEVSRPDPVRLAPLQEILDGLFDHIGIPFLLMQGPGLLEIADPAVPYDLVPGLGDEGIDVFATRLQ
jgi:hypothetical protein